MKADKSLYLQLGTDKALKLSEIVATIVNSMSQLSIDECVVVRWLSVNKRLNCLNNDKKLSKGQFCLVED